MAELLLDLSKYDGEIDLEAWVNQRNLWGVIIKFGGNEQAVGGRYSDELKDRHYALAKELGIHIGAYYYTDTVDIDEAFDDADHFASLLDGYDFDLPCYMDVEDRHQFELSPRELTDIIATFCDRLNEHGYYAGLYTGGSAWLNNMYSDELTKYANWIASWKSSWPDEAGDIGMWQQGCGNLEGDIVFEDTGAYGYHDIDWCVIDYPSRINSTDDESKSQVELVPKQPISEPLNCKMFAYRAHCQNYGWFDIVRDGQIAGSTGYSARLEALQFYVTQAIGDLEASVYVQTKGWLNYIIHPDTLNSDRPICGTTGEALSIEAIRLSLKNNYTGLRLRYCTHIQDVGWTSPVWDGEVSGSEQSFRRIEAIRIWLDDPENPFKDPNTDMKAPVNIGRAMDVINAAYGELGYYAPDDPEPGSKYGRWMADLFNESWLAGPSESVWWCCMFVSWCLDKANVHMDGFPSYNTDVSLNSGASEYEVDIYDVQYGDIVIFDWNWDGATDHIGFATGSFDGTGFTTIEGNIGNAVTECYRQMGNVAHVIRPPYGNPSDNTEYTASIDTDPKNNRDGGTLDIDGIGGWNTIIDWQHQLGTTEDGRISGQDISNKVYHGAMGNIDYDEIGSKLVMAVQAKVGADVDGQWGKDTSTSIQKWLNANGYSCPIDGYFNDESVKALQCSLNDKKWMV